MSQFTAHGPFAVPVYKGKAGRVVRGQEGQAFFRENPHYKKRKGVYVFAFRAGGGITPVYVGKATKTFGQECFTDHKLGKCNEALADYAKGTLVVFFICASEGKGKPPTKQIKLVEDFFIQTGISVNADLLNVKGTQQEKWKVAGVVRAGRGKPTEAARLLRTAFGL